MKRKIIYLSILALLILPSCNDYLEVSSESKIENEFIFQSAYEIDKAVLGVYNSFANGSIISNSVNGVAHIHSNGLFYDALSVGSDIELGPEQASFGARYNHENCYPSSPLLSDMPSTSWENIYTTINLCNIIIDGIEKSDMFQSASDTTPSDITHLYGEVISIRATMYYELTKCWGDVVYSTKPILVKEDYENLILTDRSTIQEGEIANLIKVEPMMYPLNSGGNKHTAIRMSKEYVQGLIGRLALIRGGFALRPANYSGDGEIIQSHPEWGKMVRRTDWKNYYQIANTYLKKLVEEGNAVLCTNDPRNPAEKYSNPFQYYFQQMMDFKINPESIFEVSQTAGTATERPYAFGRPSDGGSPDYPPKAYGQIRFFPTYYYGMFNPKDLRRDVTVTATALGGKANEKMISFKKGNKSNGGLALNKWDYSRMADKTYAVIQRQAGINAPYMRLADMILLLAETYAALNNEGAAKAELLKIRQRAFKSGDPDYTALTTDYVNSLSGIALMEAIQNERALELGGEGQRRYDLVRWGILGKKINELQTEMTSVVNDLDAQGYHQFANGNVISKYIYTKDVTLAASGLNDILTTTCNVDTTSPLYPLLYPEWRGTFTAWSAPASVTLKNTMVAIVGLFRTLSSDSISKLTAAGYKKTNWGVDLVDDTWRVTQYGIFGGYLPESYNANYPPRYMLGIPTSTITYAEGKISNSYGIPNK
jgi:hypothetical protein